MSSVFPVIFFVCLTSLTATAAHAQPRSSAVRSKVRAWLGETAHALQEAHAPPVDLRLGPLGVPRNQLGSGTAWLPRTSPSYSLLFGTRRWGLWVRGNVFAGYGIIPGGEGLRDAVSVNSLLLAALGDVGRGELVPRAVLSWESFLTPDGSPALMQAAEASPLHRQEPHQLLSELSVSYRRPIHAQLAWLLYAAVAGDPALGPATYTFRPSAFFSPMAPASRVHLESTRSSFGVLTVGLFSRHSKIEMSWFNSRSRADRHFDLDLALPRSVSLRLSLAPRPSLSFQTSYGLLRPRGHDSRSVDVQRWTVSAHHNRRWQRDRNWASTLALGLDRTAPRRLEGSLLAETAWSSPEHHTIFARLELLRRAAGAFVGHTSPNALVPTGLAHIGYVFTFRPFVSLAPGIGTSASLGLASSALDHVLPTPFSGLFMVYGQLRQASLIKAAGP